MPLGPTHNRTNARHRQTKKITTFFNEGMEQHAQERSDDNNDAHTTRGTKSIKRPRDAIIMAAEEEDVPDLAEYFHQFGMTKKQQIAVCRTYANHLAAALRSVDQD